VNNSLVMAKHGTDVNDFSSVGDQIEQGDFRAAVDADAEEVADAAGGENPAAFPGVEPGGVTFVAYGGEW
jgi:acyl dehydratase